MIKFIHTADIHFGVENYGRIDHTTGIHTRLLDFYRALGICIDRAIDEKVDFFLFAGDAYKTAQPTPTQQRLLLASFLRLFRAKIPIVMVIGNHDHALSFGKAHALDLFGQIPLHGFYVLSKPTTIQLVTQNGPINIVGIPWPTRTNMSLQNAYTYSSGAHIADQLGTNVAHTIAHHAAALDPSLPAVLAGHLTVSTGIFSGSEKRAIYGTDPILHTSQLAIAPFDYVALGHLHRYQDLNQHGYPAVVYSGSVERVDFGERTETKGFCLVTIPEKGKACHEFIPITTRPFVQVVTNLDDTQNQTDQIIEQLKQHTIIDAVIKIIYHIPAGLRDRVDKARLQAACADAHYVASIVPMRTMTTLTPRCSRISAEMDLSTLLSTYLATKPELLPYKDRLTQKLLALAEE
jgi:exonuclease SbcD